MLEGANASPNSSLISPLNWSLNLSPISSSNFEFVTEFDRHRIHRRICHRILHRVRHYIHPCIHSSLNSLLNIWLRTNQHWIPHWTRSVITEFVTKFITEFQPLQICRSSQTFVWKSLIKYLQGSEGSHGYVGYIWGASSRVDFSEDPSHSRHTYQ